MIRVKCADVRDEFNKPIKNYVMVGSQDDEPAEFGEWITPVQAVKLAQRLMKAANQCEIAEMLRKSKLK